MASARASSDVDYPIRVMAWNLVRRILCRMRYLRHRTLAASALAFVVGLVLSLAWSVLESIGL